MNGSRQVSWGRVVRVQATVAVFARVRHDRRTAFICLAQDRQASIGSRMTGIERPQKPGERKDRGHGQP
jgi:hypothetical protein